MLFAHVSDFHVFSAAPETSLVRKDAADAAGKVVADLAAFRPALAGVMLTGDLCDGGSAEDYALLRAILAPLRMPVFPVPGNHDRRDTMRAAFPDLAFSCGDFFQYEAALGPMRILALDTLVPGKVHGELCPVRLDWLESRLARPFAGPTLVLMHHPPFPSGIDALDRMALAVGGDRLADILARHRGRVRILSGHIHRPYQALWHGHPCAVAGSPAFQIGLDLTPDIPEPGPVTEPYAWFVHRLAADGTVSIHARYLPL